MNPLLSVKKFFAKRRELRDFRNASAKDVFTRIYLTNRWGDAESVSGKGSNLQRTAGLAAALPGMLKQVKARTLLDIPCGDFHWMKEVDLSSISYTGADIVEPLIERNRQLFTSEKINFQCLDLTSDRLPTADVILCRECLVHLSFAAIFRALANIRSSGSQYLFTTHFPALKKNHDIITGKHRPLNLTLPPFNWPAPEFIFEEYDTGRRRGMKCLAVWKIDSLPGSDSGERETQ